ncbi:MarR family winged helix-turn-helix transcriptional regulator [Amorphus coralli]|uniref:MarR family winged helix-turn-helix transcriptional regulator n=1 Tax=Amorphus coralli TaxID=340680 RepID=UPI000367CFDF|nr:MarR family transcriptional regulator [Amorphus coralli]
MDATLERPSSVDEVRLGEMHHALGFLVRLAQLKIYERFFEMLGEHDMRPGEYSVLSVIAENPGIRQGVLAQKLIIKRAHITKLVRAFEDKGLVSRRIPDEDRRVVELTLTRKGHAFLDARRPLFSEFEKVVPEGMSVAERDQLVRLLQKYLGLAESEDR